MNAMLKIFEPTTLPKANSVFRLAAAATEAASSGSDVPHAISVIDIKASFTPHSVAIFTALSTKKSQPTISTAKPIMVRSVALNRL